MTAPGARTSQVPATGDVPMDRALLRLLLVATFGSVLLNLSATTVSVGIDTLMRALHAPLASIQWIVTGYLLALTLVLPLFRWVVERLGSRRLYVGCLLAFGATSCLCALAWSAPSLIAFRVVQGAVGGLLAPLTQTLIAQLAGPQRMGRAVSFISVPALVAPVLGPLLGGLVIQRLSWRWLFLINAPLAVVGATLAHRHLPVGGSTHRTRLDVVGLLLLSPGIALFTYGLAAVGRTHAAPGAGVYGPLALSVVLVTAFALDAARRPQTALLNLALFRHRTVSAALATFLMAGVASFGANFVLPLYFQQVRGESPLRAGLLIAPQGVGMLLTMPQVGRWTDRMDPGHVVMAGVITTLLGTWAFTRVTDHTPYWLLAVSLMVRGAGLGATNTPALAAAYRHLSRDEIPNATTAINVVQRMAAPVGTAAMAVTLQRLATADVRRSHALLAGAFAHTMQVSAALSVLAFLAAMALALPAAAPRTASPP